MDILNSSKVKGAVVNRRGFSLIELLVVIGLIALLGTLTVIGIAKLQTHGKQQQTRLILQNLQSMFTEYDVNRRVPFGMGNFSAFNSLLQTGSPSQQNILNAIFMPCPQNVTLDYNNNAESSTPLPMAPLATADRKGLDKIYAVPLTRSIMAQILASPSNAAAIGKLPSGALMTFAGFDPSVTSPPVWNTTTPYKVGQYVEDSQLPPNIYIRTQVKLDLVGNLLNDDVADAPPNYYYWTPALRVPNPTVLPKPNSGTPLSTPVILDAWGNPIIFVLGGVLGAPTTSATGTISVGGNPFFPLHSPDFHPFFASAGPDGDFSKGDDNLYSYEK